MKLLVWQFRYSIWLLKHPWFQFKTTFRSINSSIQLCSFSIQPYNPSFQKCFSASQTSSRLIQTCYCAFQISSLKIQNSQLRRIKCHPSIPICNSSPQIYTSSIPIHYSTIQTGLLSTETCNPSFWNNCSAIQTLYVYTLQFELTILLFQRVVF